MLCIICADSMLSLFDPLCNHTAEQKHGFFGRTVGHQLAGQRVLCLQGGGMENTDGMYAELHHSFTQFNHHLAVPVCST